MHQTLIVARMNPAAAPAVADIFAESDATDLPGLVGVTRRVLFSFHDLYFHLAQADEDITEPLYRARKNALFKDINTKLGRYISPYDPNWREPKDAMASPFYVWENEDGGAHR